MANNLWEVYFICRQFEEIAYVELEGKCYALSADGNQENATNNNQGKASAMQLSS
jgi:hypothetical protein